MCGVVGPNEVSSHSVEEGREPEGCLLVGETTEMETNRRNAAGGISRKSGVELKQVL